MRKDIKNIINNLALHSIIDTFIVKNIKQLQLIKTCKNYDIYNIKNYDIIEKWNNNHFGDEKIYIPTLTKEDYL